MNRKIMEREGKDTSWDFLKYDNGKQLQLINDIMDSLQESGSGYGLCHNNKYCYITHNGRYITYYAFVRGLVKTMGEEHNMKLQAKDKCEAEENKILLSVLKSLALNQPKFFKPLYNLTASSAEDTVEELEIRFITSPALRASLPAVLCTMLAKNCKVELSYNGKKAIDENLTTLERDSALGNYRYAGSLAKLDSLSPLWLMGGPIGIAIGALWNIFGKHIFSAEDESAEKNSSCSNGEDHSLQFSRTMLLACALIMIRRENYGITLNEHGACRVVRDWLADDRRRNTPVSTTNLVAAKKTRERKLLGILFLKILKAKDEKKFHLVMKAYGYDETKRLQADSDIDSKIAHLLPHSAHLVRTLWADTELDHRKDYAYTMAELKARMAGHKCLVTEFNPSFVDGNSSVHFLVDKMNCGDTMLCLELMGCDSTAVCKELSSLQREYDYIFVSNKSQREALAPYALRKVYSLYEMFDGSVAPSVQKTEEVEKNNELLKEQKEQLLKKDKQIAKYEKRIRFLGNAIRSFRHTRMPNINGSLSDSIEYLLKIQEKLTEPISKELSGVIRDVKDVHDMLDKFTRQLAKPEDICEVSLLELAKEVFNNIRKDIKVEYINNCAEGDRVFLSKEIFKEWVLVNIKSNIERHAFPEGESIDNPRVRIIVDEDIAGCVLTIENNGKEFVGDSNLVFSLNTKFGETAHSGEGLYLAKCYMDDYQCGGKIMLIPNPCDDYSVAMEIKIRK